MTDVNIPLLRKAVEWAETEAAKPAELREWEQGFYVLPQRDDDPRVNTQNPWLPSIDREQLGKSPECGTCYCIAGYVDQVVNETPSTYDDIEESAVAALGLSYSDGSRLFSPFNDIEDVRRIAEEIAGERL